MTAPIPTIDRRPDRPDRPDGGAPPRGGLRWWAIALGGLALVALTAALVVLFVGDRSATDETAPDAQPTAPPADEQPAPAEEPVIEYGSESRANWDVTGVAAGDTLNVRSGPGVTFPVTATLERDTVELESTGRIATVDGQLWREIVVPGATSGWVNARYLTEHAPPEPAPAPAPQIRYGSESRANWDVTGVAAGDTLNVRSGPGVSFAVTAALARDTVELESTGRVATVDGQLWREIVVPGATTGWVNARYLTEHAPPAWLDDIGVGLPAPATTTAREIALLARRGGLADLAGLALAGESPFTASFGQEVTTAAQLVALWEAIGRDEVLETISALVALPDWYETEGTVGGEPISIYVTPRFMHETTDANRRLLEEALGADTVREGIVDGQWLGWRLGIDADGDWRFFVTGD